MRDAMQIGRVTRMAIGVIRAFDFVTPNARGTFLQTVGIFAAIFAAGWLIQLTGLLDPVVARGNELILSLFIVLFLPMNAAVTRRLADTRVPPSLIFLPYILFAAAATARVVFDADSVGWVLMALAWAATLGLVAGVLMPSRARVGDGP